MTRFVVDCGVALDLAAEEIEVAADVGAVAAARGIRKSSKQRPRG